MKFLLAIVVCLGVGFFAGYMFTRNQINTPLHPTTIAKDTSFNRTGLIDNPTSSAPGPAETISHLSSLSYENIETVTSIFSKLKLTHELADQSSFGQLETYIKQAASSRDPLYNYNIVSIFLEKMTSLDPLAAIEFIDANRTLSNSRFIGHVVTSWVREDPEAAIDYLNTISNSRMKNEIAARLLADPTLVESGFTSELEASLGSTLSGMSQIMQVNQLPPPQALEEALAMTHPNRMSAVQAALIRMLRDNPDDAMTRIRSHPNVAERNQMLQSIMHEYLNIDEDSAFAVAQASFSDNVQLEQQMLSMLGQRNPKRALPMVEAFIARTGNLNPLNGIISTWIQQNPTEALAYIESVDEQQRGRLYQSAAFSYVNSHPDEGFNWLLAQSDRYPQLVEGTVANSINYNTVNIAERLVAQTTNPRIRTRLITGIGNYKASQNPDQALAWLEEYQRDPAYPAAVQNVISSMSHQNPKGAAAAIESRINEKYAVPLVGQIASNWYQASPRESMAWLQGLPNGPAKIQALSSIVSSVAHQDPEAAMAILDTIPKGQQKIEAKRNIAYARLARSPEDIENILEDLDLRGKEATQLRAMAKQRVQVSSGLYRP